MTEKNTMINDERVARLKKLIELRKLNINPYPANQLKNRLCKRRWRQKRGLNCKLLGE